VLVAEAINAGAPIEEIYVETGLALPAVPPDAEVYEVSPGVLQRVLDADHPRPFAAVLRIRSLPLVDLAALPGPILGAVELRDPGNVGTLLRAAEAAGLAGVLTTVGSADLFAPKTVRAAAGATFRVPVATAVEIRELLEVRRRLVATVPRGGMSHRQVTWTPYDLLLLGNEARGLPTELIERSDILVSIEMPGRADSLNVAMAGTLLAFEATTRQ
jgi:TrmH family RNA methyltransferase